MGDQERKPMRVFNTTGVCNPEKHYMVDLSFRLKQIGAMVGEGKYFTINRARQYGKTTTLAALESYLKDQYIVIDLDFQDIGDAGFADENDFSRSFATIFSDAASESENEDNAFVEKCKELGDYAEQEEKEITLLQLFRKLKEICAEAPRPVVLMIDEVDTATNNQVFLDFLAQLRSLYLKREKGKKVSTFHSVILAGVTDVKNLKRKIRPEESHKTNSPWNIAANFDVDMRLSEEGIAGMLADYEMDHRTGMDVGLIAREIYAHTSGYPFLVSRICKVMDESLIGDRFSSLSEVWTLPGVSESVRQILTEKNALFDSLMGKVYYGSELSEMIQRILFAGDIVSYNPDNLVISDAEMYGFVQNDYGNVKISNRIFETRLYNYYLSTQEMQASPLFRTGANHKAEFIREDRLQMEKILKKYQETFADIYDQPMERFSEAEGRRRFLLFIRPIINGTGNYYIEAQTRNNERMDLVIDYLGERHVVELKIWNGLAYHEKGEQQLANYLEYYHLSKGYLLTYNFNKTKQPGQKTVTVDGKTLVETMV